MAKFHYRMQSILNITQQMEMQARMEYAAAQEKLRRASEYMAKLREERAGYMEEGSKMRRSELNVVKMRENTRIIEQTDERIKAQETVIAEAERGLNDARTRLQEVMTQRKTHEKLRDKAFEEFMQDEKSKEGREVDELVSYKYGQRIKAAADERRKRAGTAQI
jgi:flagellar FliJ protein